MIKFITKFPMHQTNKRDIGTSDVRFGRGRTIQNYLRRARDVRCYASRCWASILHPPCLHNVLAGLPRQDRSACTLHAMLGGSVPKYMTPTLTDVNGHFAGTWDNAADPPVPRSENGPLKHIGMSFKISLLTFSTIHQDSEHFWWLGYSVLV